MKRSWKKDRKQGDSDEDELKHPEVYFSFGMSCDIEPEDLLNRISFEWGGMKGRRLQIKDLPYLLLETPFALYKIYNQGYWSSIIRELTTILGKARDASRKDENLEEEYEARHIPPMTFSYKNVPELPGQDTSQFKNWPWKIQVNRKVLHIEVDKGETKFIEELIEVVK